MRQFLGGDKIVRVELSGKTTSDTVEFTGRAGATEWKGSYADGFALGGGSPSHPEPG